MILIALLISYYIIVIKLGNDKKLSNSQQQYSGIAREPEKLSELQDAIKELEKLIQKLIDNLYPVFVDSAHPFSPSLINIFDLIRLFSLSKLFK